MAKLVYFMQASLDLYIEDASGSFAWAAPDDEVHQLANDLMRTASTGLYGRRMYEVMRYWDTAHEDPDLSPVARDFADVWKGVDKIIYSRTLDAVDTARTRLERDFDAAAVRALKAQATKDLLIAGPALAAHAFAAGLVDEIALSLAPIAVGAGKRALPEGVRLDLALLRERRFASGWVHLAYAVRSPSRQLTPRASGGAA